MVGTPAGGKKAAKANIEKFGKDFYKIIGSKGGQSGEHRGGFACNRALARIAGAKGGRKSRRNGISKGEGKIHHKEYIWKGDNKNETVLSEA